MGEWKKREEDDVRNCGKEGERKEGRAGMKEEEI